MPSATPFPRSPSVLTLYNATDLLTGPGCPVCRYAAEAGDRYLAWFALEAHADAGTITRLCASLGMCPRHTRRLMSQPGAATRLTAVYRYLVDAGRAQLAVRKARLVPCPACAHDSAAAGRSLDTLIGGLGEAGFRERYRDLGGLCVPHLLAVGSMPGRRRAAAWLTEIMIARLDTSPPSLELLAGGPDDDADARAVLRATLPAWEQPEFCQVCQATARAERDHLTRLTAGAGWGGDGQLRRRSCLCAGHLHDACTGVTHTTAQAALTWHAEQHMARLVTPPAAAGRGDGPFSRLRSSHRQAAGPDACAVCRTRYHAAEQEIERCRQALRAPLAQDGQHVLCVRHVLGMGAIDIDAGRVAARQAGQRASTLIYELAEAFRQGTWAHRNEATGQETTAWLRAAAFLDGDVFGGCPPGIRRPPGFSGGVSGTPPHDRSGR